MNNLLPALFAAFALATLPAAAPAALLITISQSGSDVVVSGSGSLNTTGLTFVANTGISVGINPNLGAIFLSGTGGTDTLYSASFSGSSNFGPGGGIAPTSGTGTLYGLTASSNALYVPVGYTSGTSLTGASTYANASFASLGITPGNYTFNYSASQGGAIVDTITVRTNPIPEPSTWALLSVCAGALGLGTLRQRIGQRKSSLTGPVE